MSEPGTYRLWRRLHAQFDLPTAEEWGASEQAQLDQQELAELVSSPNGGQQPLP